MLLLTALGSLSLPSGDNRCVVEARGTGPLAVLVSQQIALAKGQPIRRPSKPLLLLLQEDRIDATAGNSLTVRTGASIEMVVESRCGNQASQLISCDELADLISRWPEKGTHFAALSTRGRLVSQSCWHRLLKLKTLLAIRYVRPVVAEVRHALRQTGKRCPV